jgi:hypothetical protein
MTPGDELEGLSVILTQSVGLTYNIPDPIYINKSTGQVKKNIEFELACEPTTKATPKERGITV